MGGRVSESKGSVVAIDRIESRILLVRGHKVLLDSDLAAVYGVTTKRFNEQVRRNAARFPEDFMFRLSTEEWDSLRCRVEADVRTVGLALACIRSFLLRARLGRAVAFPSRLSHRSGRADFPHPARQDTGSLRDRSAECTTTGSTSGNA
jgi:ORF6N domain-containing protein